MAKLLGNLVLQELCITLAIKKVNLTHIIYYILSNDWTAVLYHCLVAGVVFECLCLIGVEQRVEE